AVDTRRREPNLPPFVVSTPFSRPFRGCCHHSPTLPLPARESQHARLLAPFSPTDCPNRPPNSPQRSLGDETTSLHAEIPRISGGESRFDRSCRLREGRLNLTVLPLLLPNGRGNLFFCRAGSSFKSFCRKYLGIIPSSQYPGHGAIDLPFG